LHLDRFLYCAAVLLDLHSFPTRRSSDLASAWEHEGLNKGERIGLMLPNTPYYIIAYYAAMKLGLIVVQINPNYTMRELLEIIKDSEISYLVVDDRNAENGKQVKE